MNEILFRWHSLGHGRGASPQARYRDAHFGNLREDGSYESKLVGGQVEYQDVLVQGDQNPEETAVPPVRAQRRGREAVPARPAVFPGVRAERAHCREVIQVLLLEIRPLGPQCLPGESPRFDVPVLDISNEWVGHDPAGSRHT